MCWEILVPAALSIFGAVAQHEQAAKAEKTQKQAMDQASTQAAQTAALAEQANNKANAASPNTAAIQAQNQVQAQAGGGGATMLTGPSGVDPSKLQLGKNSLLGS